MYLYVCPGEVLILDSRLANFREKLSLWSSACSIFIMVQLFLMRPSFSLVSWTDVVR